MQVGVNFWGKGVWPSLYDVVVSWLRLLPTSILDVYKVFEHLEMLWMGMLYIPNTGGRRLRYRVLRAMLLAASTESKIALKIARGGVGG